MKSDPKKTRRAQKVPLSDVQLKIQKKPKKQVDEKTKILLFRKEQNFRRNWKQVKIQIFDAN